MIDNVISQVDYIVCSLSLSLSLSLEQELDNFPVDVSILKPLRQRVNLARKLDSEDHKLVDIMIFITSIMDEPLTKSGCYREVTC